MQRRMMLEDDIKEYWGFYLLKDSTVKLSVCSRHEGASFIVVKVSLRPAKQKTSKGFDQGYSRCIVCILSICVVYSWHALNQLARTGHSGRLQHDY